MAKRIIVVCGSPRKHGNTNTVVKWVVEAAQKAGAEVEVVDAAAMTYKANGCTECMACQKSDKYECVIDDEASKVIARIPQFDVFVLATPIFWFGPSAQLKLLLDRTFALAKFDPETGEPAENRLSHNKMMCLIATAAGDLDSGLNQLDESFRTAACFMKCEYQSLLVPLAPARPKDMEQRTDVRKQADDFGRKLAI